MSNDTDSTRPAHLDRRRLRRGFAGFSALTMVGLGVLFLFARRFGPGDVVPDLSAGFFLLAALSAAADLLIGASRYQIFLRRIKPGTSLWLPIRADLANRFVGAMTPSQTGGGPAQVFILYRGGIPVPASLSFLMINFVSTLVFFLLAGSATAWWLRDQLPYGPVRYFMLWGFVVFLGGLALMIVGLLRPDVFVRRIGLAVAWLERRQAGWARMGASAGRFLLRNASEYERSCTRFTRDAPWLVVASFVLTGVLYLNKFTLGWLIVRGLGGEGTYATVLAVQALLHFLLYVAPTPGGSGIAELLTGALMAVVLPAGLLGPFTLAQRFFLLYLPAALGAGVLAQEFRPRVGARASASVVGFGLLLALAGIGTSSGRSAAQERVAALPPVSVAYVGPGGSLLPTAPASMAGAVAQRKRMLREALGRGTVDPDENAMRREFTRAVDLGRMLVEAAPTDPDAHYLLSISLGLRLEVAGLREKIRMGGEARREAETALEIDPTHAGAHHVMGRLHAATMRMSRVFRFVAQRVLGADALAGASWDEAEAHFLAAQAAEPWNPRHSMELGALYLDTDRPEEALAALRRASAGRTAELSDSMAVARATELLESMTCAQELCPR